MIVHASAPGKLILFGEHFVVYGKPAIVMAIDRRVHVTASPRENQAIYIQSHNLNVAGVFHRREFEHVKGGPESVEALKPIELCVEEIRKQSGKELGVNISITSQIPVAAGLGSSASVAVATTAAVVKLYDLELSLSEINNIAFEAEKLVHRTPSGVDNTIATFGGVAVYRKGEELTPLKVPIDIPIVIGDTKISRITGALVQSVRERKMRHPHIMEAIIEGGEQLALEAALALQSGDLAKVGELMNINHGLLWAIGVSNEELDRMVYAAIRAGALGAKLTGAGGGGCMFALTTVNQLEDVADALRRLGKTPLLCKKSDIGVQVSLEN